MSRDIISVAPDVLAATIRERMARSVSELSAYWIQVKASRTAYAADLREKLADDPVAVITVNDRGFDIANAVLSDLVRLLNQYQSMCEAAFRSRPRRSGLGIVLVALGPLSVPQLSSAVPLPGWFPIHPGEVITLVIEDLTWTADVSLNDLETTKVDELCERLYELEGALLARLAEAYGKDESCGTGFFAAIKRGKHEDYARLLETFRRQHKAVGSPTGFRPSRKEGGSLTARLWTLVQGEAPDKLSPLAEKLASALAMGGDMGPSWYESLAAVIRRPTSREGWDAVRFAGDLLVTVAVSCQFVTAAAHAGEYRSYPVPLLVSFSYDLRRSLLSAEQVLRL
jgi:hypothetical protein